MVKTADIKAQLALGFGGLVLLLLVLGGVGLWGNVTGETRFGDYRTAARESVILADMQEDILAARLAVMKYRATDHDRALQEVRAEVTAMISEAEDVLKLADGKLVRQLTDIQERATAYADRFARAVELDKTNGTFVAIIEQTGQQIRENLTSVMATAHRQDLAPALFHVGHALVQFTQAHAQTLATRDLGDPGAGDRLQEMLTATASELNQLLETNLPPDQDQLVAATDQLVRDYTETVSKLAATLYERNDLMVAQLDVMGPQILSDIAALVDEAVSTQNVVGPQITSSFGHQFWMIFVASGLALAIGTIAALLIGRSILTPIVTVASALERLCRGDTAQTLDAGGRTDAVGQLIGAYETLRGTVGRAFTQAQMIEQIPLPIMVADPNKDFAISYMNPTMTQVAEGMADHLDIPVDQLIGTSIDTFHKNPEHQRQILSDPSRLPFSARISFAGRRFSLKVSAIMDSSGKYAGPMVVWDDITEREQLAELVNTSVEQVAEAVSRAEVRSGQLSSVADDTQQRSASVSAAAEQASTNVKSVAAATEEMSASISEISQQVVLSSSKAREASEIAQRTQTKAGQLNENSLRIGDILKMISDIAEQTNLLALNATIEAARAGEAGKGFAVVASEVKNLASQTANATVEINQQIDAMQSVTQATVNDIGTLTQNIAQISDMLSAVAAAAEEQGAATHEISRNVSEAAQGTQDVSHTIINVRDASMETDRSARDIRSITEELRAISGELGTAARRFLDNIRAA